MYLFFTCKSYPLCLLRMCVCVCVFVAYSCPALCNPINYSPPGPSIHGILQARTLEWVAISFSKRNYRRKKVKSLSHIRLFVTPWTVAYQALPSMEFSRHEYWSGLPFPSPWEWYIKRENLSYKVKHLNIQRFIKFRCTLSFNSWGVYFYLNYWQ